jgi:hypothetical protein
VKSCLTFTRLTFKWPYLPPTTCHPKSISHLNPLVMEQKHSLTLFFAIRPSPSGRIKDEGNLLLCITRGLWCNCFAFFAIRLFERDRLSTTRKANRSMQNERQLCEGRMKDERRSTTVHRTSEAHSRVQGNYG